MGVTPRSAHGRTRGTNRNRCPATDSQKKGHVTSSGRKIALEFEHPIPNVYWVKPARTLAGEYPCSVDPHLFAAYGSSLFAQDEMQVVKHPALGALREALDAEVIQAVTVETGRPTPVLVAALERRCRVATDRNVAEGRPHGLYGNAFARADASAVRQATTRSGSSNYHEPDSDRRSNRGVRRVSSFPSRLCPGHSIHRVQGCRRGI